MGNKQTFERYIKWKKKSSGSWVVGKMDSRDGVQDEMWVKMKKIYENYEKKRRESGRPR